MGSYRMSFCFVVLFFYSCCESMLCIVPHPGHDEWADERMKEKAVLCPFPPSLEMAYVASKRARAQKNATRLKLSFPPRFFFFFFPPQHPPPPPPPPHQQIDIIAPSSSLPSSLDSTLPPPPLPPFFYRHHPTLDRGRATTRTSAPPRRTA